ncbi:MAG: TIR domain-containing protein [Bacilli bacterium]|jgi:hypothetical protein|nr:TIR domain-containing protein [Bacilli bacterium]MDY0064210.1 TIR domain-containing protein [Bacilli bacterium]
MNKQNVYVAFDGKNDIKEFANFEEWEKTENYPFHFINGMEVALRLDKESDEVLKKKLGELIDSCAIFVVLVTKTTKSFRRFVKWQVEYAIEKGMPIIVSNTNLIRSVDYDRCPMKLKKALSLHIANNQEIVSYALLNWPASHQDHLQNERIQTFRYEKELYDFYHIKTSPF